MLSFLEKLKSRIPLCTVSVQEPMERHTTFRAGGPADYYIEPGNPDELCEVLLLCREEGMPCFVIGNGSNLLVSDTGYRGAIVSTGKACTNITVKGTRITAGAGVPLSTVSRLAMQAGLAGMEFASGIPGSMGGAVAMNAGAYGSEMKDILVSALALTDEGKIVRLSSGDLGLEYRTSVISKRGYIVLEAEFSLKPGLSEEIRGRMEELARRRREKQPLEYPSAGSTFKRPEGHFAGKLIQDAGLRGLAVGGAQVSEKHCGFIVNRGGAAASDIMRLCREVQRRVEERFGIALEMEVKILGEFEL